MVAAYRDGHAAATWAGKKPVKASRTADEVTKRSIERFFDLMVPGIGSVPASWKKYRRERDRGAFIVGWVDAMNRRDAKPKTGDILTE